MSPSNRDRGVDELEARRAVSPKQVDEARRRRRDGYRSSKRTSKAGKASRRAAAAEKRRERVASAKRRVAAGVRRLGRALGLTAGGAVALIVILLVGAVAVNQFARWNARRAVDEGASVTVVEESRRNLLVIATDDAGASGFLAVRTDPDGGRVFGIAVPEGAFMEVPGHGFDRAGASYEAGPELSVTTISNFLSVPFEHYVVVEDPVYQQALRSQDLEGLLGAVLEADLSPGDVGRFSELFAEAEGDDVAIVPLPVEPITLGDQTYFEPDREEIADLVYSWWGVRIGSSTDRMRIIVYNGSGVPGIASVAAQELIEEGFRVVETGNADSFDHESTLVYAYSGAPAEVDRIVETLGVGEITPQEGNQEVADVIVVIGADYAPAGVE